MKIILLMSMQVQICVPEWYLKQTAVILQALSKDTQI
jgi:hypothetical protein